MNDSIAIVDNRGRITGISPGVAKIQFSEKMVLTGDVFFDTVDVEVLPFNLELSLEKRIDSIPLLKKVQLTPKGYYFDQKGNRVELSINANDVQWISMSDRVARINSKGVIKGTGVGDTYIYYIYKGVMSRSISIVVTK